METQTHHSAATRYVDARGTQFAYRRFGRRGGVPLLFNMHFTGTMDHWDPAITDGLAEGREVILFDNRGISSTDGVVPESVEEMADDALSFVRALDLQEIDVLGFSLGGLVAQEMALQAPSLVRRLVLVGTGPRGGEAMQSLTPEAQDIFRGSYDPPDHLWLRVFFAPSESSQAAGRAFLERFRRRTTDRDPEVDDAVAPAQLAALGKWGATPPDAFAYLERIRQPALVVNGDADVIIYSVNSWILQQYLPDAKLIIYPDANHGSLYQYPAAFVRDVDHFLKA
ncbi:alpha/beta hydrolase [Luteibacter sp. 3190]|uniref:alpha/beta fold hydrolase n=1 Tax=Luteibacter sp. 3190 TaxID=2817736 RepID=UPI00285499FE|nr:alpha/beta hydrolase [Luteibacter sp. 3190]MDR6936659.1 pimeloyl-ACP methyl ester carboxylesterase [Luteibacter sp. 3190]